MSAYLEAIGHQIRHPDRVLLSLAAMATALAIIVPVQAAASLVFVAENFVSLLPFILLSVAVTAYASATGADNLVARAFYGRPGTMIVVAALVGALSPFCSCGVIPLIAAMLAMGVPLSAVMAFWLASPIIDPSMFVLTVGALGYDFAIAKLVIAAALGMFGGFAVLFLQSAGGLENPLKPGVGGGCGADRFRNPGAIIWKFWRERPRMDAFIASVRKNTLFLGKWLALAFFLESLMLAYLPGDYVAALVGDGGFAAVGLATIVGIPAYLNGYAALPLVGTLMEQGMAPGAAMAFLVAGGVTSIPAATAVWALARPPVFAAYLTLALAGALIGGMLFQLWSVL